jgi:hypothetical protein
VIDNHSQKTDFRRRFPVAAHWVTRLAIALIACSWLFLYLDSVHQRRRAEAFVANLKSLDSATAGFTDVRDLVIRNGGYANPAPSSLARPDFPTPSMPDLHGNISFYNPWPPCTRQDCTFIVWINTRLARLPFPLKERTIEFLYSALPYIGVRSWVLGAIFEVRNGKLERSQMGVWELRTDRLESGYPRRLIPLGYEVDTLLPDSPKIDLCRHQDHRVFLDNGHQMPQNVLRTCVLQTAGTPIKRALDINLRCLNGIFRGCRFDELAPLAWAEYSAKGDGRGTNELYK